MGFVIPAILLVVCLFFYTITRPGLTAGQKIVWTIVNILSCIGIALYLFTGTFTDRYDAKVLDPGINKQQKVSTPSLSDTVYTVKPQDPKLPVSLTEALRNDGFQIHKEEKTNVVYRNCNKNDSIFIKGSGISMYRLTKGTLYDEGSTILLLRYTFSDKKEGSNYLLLMQHALFRKGVSCNKNVHHLVSDGNDLYDFSSDSELFRIFIEQYAGLISSN